MFFFFSSMAKNKACSSNCVLATSGRWGVNFDILLSSNLDCLASWLCEKYYNAIEIPHAKWRWYQIWAIGALYSLSKWSFKTYFAMKIARGRSSNGRKFIVHYLNDAVKRLVTIYLPFFLENSRILECNVTVSSSRKITTKPFRCAGLCIFNENYLCSPSVGNWILQPIFEWRRLETMSCERLNQFRPIDPHRKAIEKIHPRWTRSQKSV